MSSIEQQAVQAHLVFRSSDFTAVAGVARGEEIGVSDDLVLDDVYQLASGAQRVLLTFRLVGDNRPYQIVDDNKPGGRGRDLFLDTCITLMGNDGSTHEALIFAEVELGVLVDTYLLPLDTLREEIDYRLVGNDPKAAPALFSRMACVAFSRGTQITLSTGEQRRIEDLRIGDRVLTRDDGGQPVRWIGQSTIRAAGTEAPVVITKGTLHNAEDLVVSPDHRVFVYQRQDALGLGRSEVFVKVRHLINGDTIYQRESCFMEYFQLLFDEHQIIYAEGIAAESLMIAPRTKGVLPDSLGATIAPARHGHRLRAHHDFEVTEDLARNPDAAGLLRRASSS
jgi:hypothetical protein